MEDNASREFSEQEMRLIDCLVQGSKLDLDPDNETNRRPTRLQISGWGPERVIRAWVLRDILTEKYPTDCDIPDARGIQIYGALIDGRIDLQQVKSSVPLSLIGCYLTAGIDANASELRSLTLSRCLVDTPFNYAEDGTICLKDAVINAFVDLSGSKLINRYGCALMADGAQVVSDLSLRNFFQAFGTGDKGTIRLPGAKIGGQLSLTGAKLTNFDGPSLNAEGTIVDGDMLLRQPFFANSAHAGGTIRLTGARIGGQLSFTGARLFNSEGPAISANSLLIASDVNFREPFFAKGYGDHGVIDLSGSTISGNLCFKNAKLTSLTGHLLSATNLHVGQNFLADFNFKIRKPSTSGAFNLQNSTIKGEFNVPDRICNKARRGAKWSINGLTYLDCPTSTNKLWLEFLISGTHSYAAQPFRFFANTLQNTGHEREAKKVLIAQRKYKVANLSWYSPRRILDFLQFIAVAYGYRPFQALIWLLLFIFVAVAMVFWWFPEGLTIDSNLTGTSPPTECSPIQRLLVAIDMAFPIVSSGVSETCKINYGSFEGDKLALGSTLLKIPVWALVAAFVAGFSNIIRNK